jgi:predicted AAA+ superfamily ATPase
MTDLSQLDRLIDRAEALLARIETVVPTTEADLDWTAPAFRWRVGRMHAIRQVQPLRSMTCCTLTGRRCCSSATPGSS